MPSDPLAKGPAEALCLGQAFLQQPGWQTFAATARWVMDPADPAAFAAALRGRAVLVQQVVGDQVMPSIVTEQLGGLLGLMPVQADPLASPEDPVSRPIADTPNAAHWLRYEKAEPSGQFAGNQYAHFSLIGPACTGADCALGTARIQKDALTYLARNL